MSQAFSYGAATNVGLVRDNNEDCFLCDPDQGLWLVADGMGGHEAGEVASSIVKAHIKQSVSSGQPLCSAVADAHEAVKRAAANNIGSPNMGTTVVALRLHGIQYEIAWVGDSRAYLWNGETLAQLTTDHSYVQELLDSGAISAEEMRNHAQRNVITQSLGISSLDKVRVDSVCGTLAPGDKLLLCSDGLTDMVSDEEITTTLQQHYRSDQEQVEQLIAKALNNGGSDNVTVELVSAPRASNALNNLQRLLLNGPLRPWIINLKDRQGVWKLTGATLLCVCLALLLIW